VILGRISKDKEVQASLGLILRKQLLASTIKVISVLEVVLSRQLSASYAMGFRRAGLLLGTDLLQHTVAEYVARGYYRGEDVRHLLAFFDKLRTTSFEGRGFSTGLILSKSLHAYQKTGSHHRFGDAYTLTHPFRLRSTATVDRRLWYLVDGKKTFFLATKGD